MAATCKDQADRGMYSTNLSNALHRRYLRNKSVEDLDRAILMAEQAVALTPDRFYQHAILTSEKAMTLMPDNHFHRSGVLINFGHALETRFKRTGSISNRDRATELYVLRGLYT